MGEVRDFAADRKAALEEARAGVKASGGDTSHLDALLKQDAAPAYARVDVPQPMPPGSAVPGQPLSPLPVGQPEPADGSAPDKRQQDNSPKVEGGVVVGPKDPGPELKANGGLPDYAETAVRPAKAGKLPEQVFDYEEPPEPPTAEELAKEARKKDRRRDRAEEETPSEKVDANEAAPVLPDEVKENPPTPETTPKVRDTVGVEAEGDAKKAQEEGEKDAARKGSGGRSAPARRK
jgi:hypothetical protein